MPERLPATALRAALATAAVLAALIGDAAAVIVFLAGLAGLVLARQARPALELAFGLAFLALTVAYALGGLPDADGGDLVLHASLCALLSAVLTDAAQRRGLPDRSGPAAVAVLGVVWEGLELASDHLLHTHMSLGVRDTATDLAADLAGLTVGHLLLRHASR